MSMHCSQPTVSSDFFQPKRITKSKINLNKIRIKTPTLIEDRNKSSLNTIKATKTKQIEKYENK